RRRYGRLQIPACNGREPIGGSLSRIGSAVHRDATGSDHDDGCCRCDSLLVHRSILSVQRSRPLAVAHAVLIRGPGASRMIIVLFSGANARFATTCTWVSPVASARNE